MRWRALARRKEIRERAYQDALECAPENAQLTIDRLLDTLRKAESPEVGASVLAPCSILVVPAIATCSHQIVPVVFLHMVVSRCFLSGVCAACSAVPGSEGAGMREVYVGLKIY